MRSWVRGGAVLVALAASWAGGSSAGASRPAKGEPSDAPAMEVFVRDTDEDIRIRVHRIDVSGEPGSPVGGPGGVVYANTPVPGLGSPACELRGTLLVGLSTDEAVGQGGGGLLRRRTKPALVFVSSGGFGAPQGEPVVWVAVQTSRKVASVRASFRGGGRDEMEPTHGIAVLAAAVNGTPGRFAEQTGPLGSVKAFDDDGRVIGRMRLGPTLSVETGIPRECRAPSLAGEFPKAKGPPPADADAARSAIVTAYETVYNPGPSREQILAALEDGDALAATYDNAVAGNPQYAGQVSIRVDEVRFIDRRTAAVKFGLLVTGNEVLAGQIGRAKLIDGRWLVARSTFCTLVSLGGFQCPAGDDAAPSSTPTGPRPPQRVRVLVLEGSGVVMAAATTANELRGLGYAIAGTGNAAAQQGTIVTCRPGFDDEADALAKTLGPGVAVGPFPDPPPQASENADCIVTLGT